MKGLANKTCLITGGSNGIGYSICKRLIEENCNIIVVDIKPPINLGNVRYYKCNLSSENEIKLTVEKIKKEFDKIDVLVNNAAIFIMKSIEATEEDWKNILQINVIAVSNLTKYLLPLIISSKHGSIINISSISGIIGQANFAIYNATKFAINGLTKCWAIDFGKYCIRVNSILPGYIDSDSSHKYLQERELDKSLIDRKLIAQHPIGRLGTSDDVASAVAFIASEESTFITGAEIVVDGGFTIQ
jgi:dihydroanticapsin dehydrogenase